MAEIIVNILAVIGGFSLLGGAFVLLILWATRNVPTDDDYMIERLYNEVYDAYHEVIDMRRMLSGIIEGARDGA